MGASGGPAIVSANLKLAIDPADNVCNGGKSVMSDLVGSYDGTLYSGNSVKFDASDDYIACGSDTSIDMAIGDSYSITCWIKKLGTNSGNYAHILDNYCTLRNWSVGNWVNTDQLFFEWRRADNLAWTATQLSLNLAQEEWNFLAITVTSAGSGGTKTIVTRLYNSNGAPSTSTKTTTDDWSNSGTGNFNIGRSQSNGTYFNGEVSDVRVYKKVLSADEIGLIYNKPNIVLPPDVASSDLVGWWPLIDGSGTTANDYSGNDNNGTLTNGPIWVSGSATIPQTTTGFEHTASLEPSSNAGWLDFDTTNNRGSGSYMTITRDSTTIFELDHANYGNGFTWEQWINFSDESIGDGRQQIWDYGTNGDNRIAFSKISGAQSGTYQFYYRESSSVIGHFNSAAHDPTPGVWYHIVFVKRGTAGEFYLDGNALSVTTTTTFGSTGDINGTFYVGRAVQASESGYDFTGKITGINFYDRSLSHGQILKNYNAKKSRFDK